MGKKKTLETPSLGKGMAIESVCMLMAIFSIIGGIVGAILLGKATVSMYGSFIREEYIPELVAYWLIGGIGSAVFWYVVSGLGTLIQWQEFKYYETKQAAAQQKETDAA